MNKIFIIKKLIIFLLALCLLNACGASRVSQEFYTDSEALDSQTALGGASSADVMTDLSNNARSYEMSGGVVAETAATKETNSSSDDLSSENAAITEDDIESGEASSSKERKLIRTVDVSLQTTDFDELLSDIEKRTTDLNGYIESSSVDGSGYDENGLRYASYTIRIPSQSLDEFLDTSFTNGVVTSRNENIEDVTLTYTDLEARVNTLEVERDRLMELLSEAENVDAIIALETRLSEIRYQLESIESSLRVYDNQVDYSTVYIYIDEVRVTDAAVSDSFGARIISGFQRNFLRLIDTITDLVIWFITNLPAIILIIAVVFVIYKIIARFILKRGKKKNKNDNLPDAS